MRSKGFDNYDLSTQNIDCKLKFKNICLESLKAARLHLTIIGCGVKGIMIIVIKIITIIWHYLLKDINILICNLDSYGNNVYP